MSNMFGFLAGPLGFVMQFIYNLVGNYGITIILFTILVRLLMFPLSIKQQKSQVRMAAFQPMIKEIQSKWAKDQKRANEEVMKFQEENNLKMTAGCLPMAVNMIVLFGIIAVIQAPMQYMLNVTAEEISNASAIYEVYDPDSGIAKQGYTKESLLIGAFKDSEKSEWFKEGAEITTTDADGNEVKTHVAISEETIQKVNDFKFDFLGLDLSVSPTFAFNKYLIMPILSIVTMLASQFIVMKTSGQQQGQTSMLVMTVVMSVMFGWFAFTVPVGFSLYYTISNVVQTIQQLVLRKMYDPEKIKAEIMQEIEERKKAKKAKKKITVKDDKGNVVTKELSDAELARIRLAKAREIDAEKYLEEEKKASSPAADEPIEVDAEEVSADDADKDAKEADKE